MEGYDHDRGAFSTYAWAWVKKFVLEAAQGPRTVPLDDLEAVPGHEPSGSVAGLAEVQALLSTLTDEEAEIVRLRWGVDGAAEHSVRDAAAVLGASKSSVSRIENRALESLRGMQDGFAPGSK